jgi:hypothetical protein
VKRAEKFRTPTELCLGTMAAMLPRFRDQLLRERPPGRERRVPLQFHKRLPPLRRVSGERHHAHLLFPHPRAQVAPHPGPGLEAAFHREVAEAAAGSAAARRAPLVVPRDIRHPQAEAGAPTRTDAKRFFSLLFDS